MSRTTAHTLDPTQPGRAGSELSPPPPQVTGTRRSGFFFIDSITRPLGFALPQRQGPDRLASVPAGGRSDNRPIGQNCLPLLSADQDEARLDQACLQCMDPGLWSLLILGRRGERRTREREREGCLMKVVEEPVSAGLCEDLRVTGGVWDQFLASPHATGRHAGSARAVVVVSVSAEA